MGSKWSDAELIGFAYAFEQRTMMRDRIRPYIEPCIEMADILEGVAF